MNEEIIKVRREKRMNSILFKYKKEIIMTSLFLSLAIISLLIIGLVSKTGSTVEVRCDGEVIAEYSLLENGEYPLLGGKNVLVIEDGSAYMKSADCPDGTCIKTGRIRRVGESIICLPNKLAITVRGERDSDTPDLIS